MSSKLSYYSKKKNNIIVEIDYNSCDITQIL